MDQKENKSLTQQVEELLLSQSKEIANLRLMLQEGYLNESGVQKLERLKIANEQILNQLRKILGQPISVDSISPIT